MAYHKKIIYNQAIDILKSGKIYFIEHLINKLPVSKFYFYETFPVDSNEYNTIKEIIDKNKTNSCDVMIDKWIESENPTLQIAAYKQLCNDEQRKQLSTNWNENQNTGNITINWSE